MSYYLIIGSMFDVLTAPGAAEKLAVTKTTVIN
jgi:hypothetical protein